MSEDEIKCSKCGSLNKKASNYCIDCGMPLEAAWSSPEDTGKVSDIYTTTPPTKKESKTSFKGTKFPYKILIYFGIVVVVNLILAIIIMMGFALGGNSYLPIFGGTFLLSMLIVGIFWGAVAVGGSDAVESVGMCGAIFIGVILVSIAIPIYIITTLGPIVGAIFSAIGEAISNAISNFFSSLFADIEIPGFEPFLFIGLFIALSIFIVYKYHLLAKKK